MCSLPKLRGSRVIIRNRKVLDELIEMTEKAFAAMEVTEDTYASMKHSINASKKGGYVLSIRSSDIAFTMGAYGRLMDESIKHENEIPVY